MVDTPRNKTKVALVKNAVGESLQMWDSWSDGLYAALDVLGGENFNIHVFGYCETPAFIEKGNISVHLSNNISSLKYWLASFDPKYVFGWGSAFDKWEELDEYNGSCPYKKILLYAGGFPDAHNAMKHFDQVVVENKSDQKYFPGSSVAFGTNTQVFRPMPDLNKNFPAFFPAAFAGWKHHELFARAMPKGSLAVGQFQEHEKQCYEVCIALGHTVIPALPMQVLPYLYNQSHGVCLTPEHMGGCQRAALEAMSCGIPVLVTSDSKAAEFPGVWTCEPDENVIHDSYLAMIEMFEKGDYNLRDEFIIGKFDEKAYANGLRKTLC